MSGAGFAVWRGSPNHYDGRLGQSVNHITLHIMVGRLAGTDSCFQRSSFGAASHYGVGGDGTVYQWVDENNGSWADANWRSDCSGVTIEHEGGMAGVPVTSPETMEAAAQLLRKGIDGSEIIEKTYFEKTYIQNQILGRALLESMLVLEKQVVVSVVSRKEMEFFEAVPSDLEGIVAQLRQTKGVEVAIFLHETDTQEYKVSLRSKGKVNVSSIAQYFGGGGHVRAAGVTMKGSAHDVINNLLRQITLQLKEA